MPDHQLTVDRIQLAVQDRQATAAAWAKLLDAVVVREDRVATLSCHRTVLAVGTSEVELLAADGTGPVHDAGPGLFAAGFASDDVVALRDHLRSHGVEMASEGDQIFIAAGASFSNDGRVEVDGSGKVDVPNDRGIWKALVECFPVLREMELRVGLGSEAARM